MDGEDLAEEEANGDTTANPSTSSDEATTANIAEIYVGSEFIKDIQVKYCDICKGFLPREDGEAAIRKHCIRRSHLNSYLKHKENERLRLAAVKVHQQEAKKLLIEKQRKMEAAEEKQKNDALNSTPSDAPETSKSESSADKTAKTAVSVAESGQEDDEEAMDSKIWADVDKDLGELLQAVSSENANDDEDEEDSTTTTER